MNLKSNEWPTRYEVGMMFERDDGELVECERIREGSNPCIGNYYYCHGHKSDDSGDNLYLTKWLNPEAFPDVPRIGQEKPSVPPPSLRKPKPQYDRDEVLRVATIIMQELSKRPDFDDMYGAGELATERAINLIDAVNKRMEGGDHAIR
jgi:hypothetical protein